MMVQNWGKIIMKVNAMLTKQQFIEYRTKLANNKNYPTVPISARELILKNLDALLLLENEQFENIAENFCGNASRFVDGRWGIGGDEMVDDIPRLDH
jgi:hypothetical protein